MGKRSKKVFSIGMLLCIALSLILTACVPNTPATNTTGTKAPTTAQPTTQAPEKPYEFSVFRTAWTNLTDTDPVILAINEKFNIKIKIITSPYETWIEKYNIYVTSGDIPDLSVTTGPGTASFNDWAAQGIYMDLLDLYNQHCPNIQKYLSDDIVEAHKMEGGKLYGIPKPSLSDTTYAIRADWLRNLNLEMPKTLDELYVILKAFKDNDPDQNNKDDTYGLCAEDTLSTIDFIFRAFGCSVPPNRAENWIPDGNGKLTSAILAPGMKDAIVYLNKLFQEGILDQEWMLTKSQAWQDKIFTGKVGFMAASYQQMINFTEAKIKANDPACELQVVDGVTGPTGLNVRPMQKGFYMVSSISKDVTRPEKILEFIDFLMTDEGDIMIQNGLEGLTYTKSADGSIVRDEEAIKNYGMEGGHKFRQIMQSTKINVLPKDDPRSAGLTEMAQILYEGPFYPAPTLQPSSLKEVATIQGADYVMNSVAQIVITEGDPAAEWDAFIENWKKTGGDKLIQEINELYEANQK
jgi:ABC-type glycerol-3-phosphate transport system substrate-binding protein